MNKNKFFFLHVPKCAGISFFSSIQKHFPEAKRDSFKEWRATIEALGDYKDSPSFITDRAKMTEYLLYYRMKTGAKVVAGHFEFSETSYNLLGNEYEYISVLREPFQRWKSHYIFNKTINDDYLVPPVRNTNTDLKEELLNFIDSWNGVHFGNLFKCFYYGYINKNDLTSNEITKKAINNLHKFDLLGTTEEFDSFLHNFEKKYGISLKNEKLNVTKNKNDLIDKDKEILQELFELTGIQNKVKKLCAHDYQIYEAALKLM